MLVKRALASSSSSSSGGSSSSSASSINGVNSASTSGTGTASASSNGNTVSSTNGSPPTTSNFNPVEINPGNIDTQPISSSNIPPQRPVIVPSSPPSPSLPRRPFNSSPRSQQIPDSTSNDAPEIDTVSTTANFKPNTEVPKVASTTSASTISPQVTQPVILKPSKVQQQQPSPSNSPSPTTQASLMPTPTISTTVPAISPKPKVYQTSSKEEAHTSHTGLIVACVFATIALLVVAGVLFYRRKQQRNPSSLFSLKFEDNAEDRIKKSKITETEYSYYGSTANSTNSKLVKSYPDCEIPAPENYNSNSMLYSDTSKRSNISIPSWFEDTVCSDISRENSFAGTNLTCLASSEMAFTNRKYSSVSSFLTISEPSVEDIRMHSNVVF